MAFAGCAHYHAQPLQSIFPTKPLKTTPHVSMHYKIFDKHDCTTYLGRNVIKYGYQPVQIALCNYSQSIFSVTPQKISLPTVPAKAIAHLMHYSSTKIWLEHFAIGALIIPGALVLILTIGSIVSPTLAEMLLYDYFNWVVLATAAVWGTGLAQTCFADTSNKVLPIDYCNKEFCAHIINPSEAINGVIFVPIQNFHAQFSLVIIDQITNKSYTLSTNNPVADV